MSDKIYKHGNTFACLKSIVFLLILFIMLFSGINVWAGTISLSPTAVLTGGTVTATWSGFNGNVNVQFFNGNNWIDANTNVPGSYSQNLVMAGYGVRNDYRIRIELRTTPGIYVYSEYFSVSDPGVSVSPSSVVQNGTTNAYWSGFASTVNVALYRDNTFLEWVTTTGDGTGQQILEMTGQYSTASDKYRIKVELKDNTNIYHWSNYFSVIEQTTTNQTNYINTLISGTQIGQQQTKNMDWNFLIMGSGLWDYGGSPASLQTPTITLYPTIDFTGSYNIDKHYSSYNEYQSVFSNGDYVINYVKNGTTYSYQFSPSIYQLNAPKIGYIALLNDLCNFTNTSPTY